MIEKMVKTLLFIVLFIGGITVVNGLMPKDSENMTTSYTEGVDVYIPPNALVVDNFNVGNKSVSTVEMVAYESISSNKNSQNFLINSPVGGG